MARTPGNPTAMQEHTTWHPIIDATEIQPGIWRLSHSSTHRAYAEIRLVRRAGELGYHLLDGDGEHVGFYVNLKSACINAWRECGGA